MMATLEAVSGYYHINDWDDIFSIQVSCGADHKPMLKDKLDCRTREHEQKGDLVDMVHIRDLYLAGPINGGSEILFAIRRTFVKQGSFVFEPKVAE